MFCRIATPRCDVLPDVPLIGSPVRSAAALETGRDVHV
jgi:hypothetical protein